IPPLTDEFFERATLRLPKQGTPLVLHVDPDVLAWFKAQGGEYEQRMNAALRIYVEAHRAYSS
ncbi:MAG TPA: BrnA antitoxin family protein, partial [Ardenticatenaceae bacterium]|nr:BrnA antitoxin family protein [Ardenticatenaceae bacterium]